MRPKRPQAGGLPCSPYSEFRYLILELVQLCGFVHFFIQSFYGPQSYLLNSLIAYLSRNLQALFIPNLPNQVGTLSDGPQF